MHKIHLFLLASCFLSLIISIFYSDFIHNSKMKIMIEPMDYKDHNFQEYGNRRQDKTGAKERFQSSENTSSLETLLKHMLTHHKPPKNVSFGYNVSQYHRNPIDTPVPDVRPYLCKHVRYELKSLANVTVIIVFHNEALTMLIRHVHVMLLHSPRDLLVEIILVDDYSSGDFLGKHFEEYLNILDSRIKLIRNNQREGIARSRLIGAKAAQGEIIVFLDAHMRCSPGWLEPLAAGITDDPTLVLQPQVPSLSLLEMGNTTKLLRAGFGWNLRLAWYFLPPYLSQMRRLEHEPFPSPSLAGCAIAVNKNTFFKMGGFDDHLEIWGGEHFELAFRTWMCGGRIETIPCSVVGHLYREIPYSFNGSRHLIVVKNLLRVAAIWMDEYYDIVKGIFKSLIGTLPTFTQRDLDAMEERRNLRRTLRCNNFTWYLEHVLPELTLPREHDVHFGEVYNIDTSKCLTVAGKMLLTTSCSPARIEPANQFAIDRFGRFWHKQMCIIPNANGQGLRIGEEFCAKNYTAQWFVDKKSQSIIFKESLKSRCLFNGEGNILTLVHCMGHLRQRWFVSYRKD